MDRSVNEYLDNLIQWGNQARATIEKSEIENQEQLLSQLDNWQHDVNQLKQMQQLRSAEKLTTVHNEGERILYQIHQSQHKGSKEDSIDYGQHKLPPLPYAYNALEPYISEEIMRLHHDVHHQGYVDGLNKAEKELYGKKLNKDLIKYWLREQAFHGSGHQLHTIFWFNMTPDAAKRPSGILLQTIESDFGSWHRFKALFTATANSVEGDGWAILFWNPRNGKLGVQSFEKHQLFQIADIIPLLVLDVWEHAYYLQYKTDKKAYVDNWWNVVNWKDVANRLNKAMKVKWELY
ncbi:MULTISPECIES: superoxide dismutase [Virgibacillus]|uniref:superoxide dismutase n=2 Tax=Virgibacillus TaxID=84406 RepID=A0A024QC19_9BACI|nr:MULTISPECIES: superoxide dismutase [Virgibacillus]EQB36065.1 hypothetical protein M948_13595 [Virgibacillus sp. CM-4]MYL41930.1 superoxide dismutase [Virgibacillus massiliensis]GGJ46926.1 putative superoxide dismutase [Fe] [Virgibacillus kapii]CDQ39760.1 Superoxide dismutase [Mn/Fe] [Virgibacillus massiliensis]